MNLSKLSDPFPAEDIEWRVQQAGSKNGKPWARVLAYVTNRAIMERLDEVCGPENWENVFTSGPSGGILCGLTIHTDDRSVTKWDGAENTDIEAVKGGLSGAMKRAAVHWGIGRYLYYLEAGFANIHPGGAHYQAAKSDQNPNKSYPAFRWDPPVLPAWALPGGSGKPEPAPRGQRPPQTPPAGDSHLGELVALLRARQERGVMTPEDYKLRLSTVYGKDGVKHLTAEEVSAEIDWAASELPM